MSDESVPFRQGMTLMPGQSAHVSINIPISDDIANHLEGRHFHLEDMSAQAFGKYQYCTQNKADGMWYSDDDFGSGGGCGPLRKGALPAPRQDTPELTARAKAMHEAAINNDYIRAVTNAIDSAQTTSERPSLLGFFRRLFRVSTKTI